MMKRNVRAATPLGAVARASALAVLLAASAQAAPPRVHAITGAKIVVAPGRTIDSGTLVLRDGVVEAVGADVAPPPDARIWERPELTIYPGLIEAYSVRSWPEADDDEAKPAGGHPNPLVVPERDITLHAWVDGDNKKLREAGFTTAVVAPTKGIFRGTGSVINLGKGSLNDNLLRRDVTQNVAFERNSFGGGYPSSLMGAMALFRQTMMDAAWHRDSWRAYEANPAQARPAANSALDTLQPLLNGGRQVVFETGSALDMLRAISLAREFGLDAMLVGSGEEYKWLDEIVAGGMPILLTLDLPETPDVGKEDDLSVSLANLRHWDRAPENPALLLDAGATIAISSHGLSEPKKLLPNVHKAIERGLSPDAALAALTTTPAALFGISDRAGTLEPGRMANFSVVNGDLFVEKPEIREVWVDGHRFEIKESKPPEIDPAGTWQLTVTTPDGQQLPAILVVEGKVDDLSGTISPGGGEQELKLSSIEVSGKALEVSFDATPIGMPGTIQFSLEIEGDSGKGSGTAPQGPFSIKGTRTSKPEMNRRKEAS